MKTLSTLRTKSRHRRHQRLIQNALRTSAALMLVLPTAQLALAQTYTWQTGTTLLDWSDGNAWVGGVAPTASSTTTINMRLNNTTGILNFTELFGTHYGSDEFRGTRNDIADPFALNQLVLSSTTIPSSIVRPVAIMGDGLHFTGLNPSIYVDNSAFNIHATYGESYFAGDSLSKYSIYDAGMVVNTAGANSWLSIKNRFIGNGNFIKTGEGLMSLESSNTQGLFGLWIETVPTGFTGVDIRQGEFRIASNGDDPDFAPSVFTPDNIKIASGARLSAANIPLKYGAPAYSLELNKNRGILLDGAGALFGNENITSMSSLTVLGTISGATSDSGFQLSGGTLVLAGANTFTGVTDLKAGTLVLRNGFALQNSTVNLGAGTGKLEFAGNSTVTFGGLSGNRDLTLPSTALVLGRNNATYSGSLSGTGGITITRGGTQTFTSADTTYSGNTTIIKGGIVLDGNASLRNSSVFIQAEGWLKSNGQNPVGNLSGEVGSNLYLTGEKFIAGFNGLNSSFNGTISGSGDFIKVGTGALTLSGDNTYTGRTTIDGGTLAIYRDNNLGLATAFDAEHLKLTGGATLKLLGTPELFANRGISIAGTNNIIDRDLSNGGFTVFFNPISGSFGNVIKTGAGALYLWAPGTFYGTTDLNQGELRLVDGNALQNSTVSLNGGLLDVVHTGTATLGGLTGNGDLNQGSTFLRVGGNGWDTTYNGVLSGNGYLEKVGNGKLTLTGMNTRTFNVGISGGTLSISNDRNLGATPSSLLPFGIGINGGTLELNNAPSISENRGIAIGGNGGTILQNGQTTINSPILGQGSLTKLGTGTTILRGEGTWEGVTDIAQGTLDVQNSKGLPTGTNLRISSEATLRTNGHSFILGSLSGAGTLDNGTANLILGQGDASGDFSGAILLEGKLIKRGRGTQALQNVITTSGGVEIESGKLMVDGAATGGITVKNGGTLGGHGTIDQLTIEAGGIVSPGNSPGTLHVSGDFTWAAGGVLDFELGSPSDYLQVENNLVKTGSGAYEFHFLTVGGFMNGTYNLIGYGNSTNFSPSDFSFSGLPVGTSAAFSQTGNQLQVSITGFIGSASAPEPATLAFALIGGALVLAKRRKH